MRSRILAIPRSCSSAGSSDCSTRREAPEQLAPVLAEERREHLLLGREVVVEQAVRDARLLGDVADAGGVVAVAREDAHGGVDDEAALLLAPGLTVAAGALARD